MLAAASAEFPTPVEVDETAIATLNYTSGTTARPAEGAATGTAVGAQEAAPV